MKRYITAQDAAEYLGLSEEAVRHRARRGDLPYIRMGRLVRFDIQDLDLWMRQQRVEPKAS